MLHLETTSQFRKDYKLMKKRGLNLRLLEDILNKLIREEPLETRHRDHALTGNYRGLRECHIQPDWLLIYAIDKGRLILTASRTGSHADLFKM
ncbi:MULTISPECIES: type II toxin-antitoxin system YafQ family toxin [Rothia]|uniref:mRNA interferase YafQ n=1 Tax=Rothia dentocariosa TaxID=2047 RepID=A0A3S4Y5W2_9MICC|nr:MULTISPECIES: type II toxin-antitoxin system YafQ family toxin [Rothia]OFR96340.1 addiction module toxin RelE [Rothia sp. HMSC067H10]VEJ31185.1 mRNA interferase YafQ [Rothia dentocariosa]VTY10612.1 mRNA interferase YafQ [Rothia dentocariosa]